MNGTSNQLRPGSAASRLVFFALLSAAPFSKNFGQCSFTQANLPQLTYPALAGNCLLLNQQIPVPGFAQNPGCTMAYEVPGLPFQLVPAGASTVTISTLPVGTTTIVWAFYIAPGYVDQHPQNILVTDPTPPSFSVCPSGFSVNLKPGRCDTILNYAAPQAFDACGLNPPAPVLISGLPSGSTFPIGATPILFRATDNSGNTANCAFTITVNDYPTPVLSCRDTVKMWFDQTCETTLKAQQILLGNNYGCPSKFDVKIKKTVGGAFVAPNFNADDAGKLYTYQLLNPANNQTCTGKVIARDTSRPVMNCGFFKDTAFTLGQQQCANWTAFKLPVVIDNCSIATFSGSPIELENGKFKKPFPPGLTTQTITATDASGNKRSCSFKVNVAPWLGQTSLTCVGQLNLSIDGSCQLEIGADALLSGNQYACFAYYEVNLFRNGAWTNNIVGPADVGKNLPYRVQYGPTSQTCWGNVLIEDKIAPVLLGKDTTLQCWQAADSLIFGLSGKPTVMEGCGTYALTFADSAVSLGCSGNKIFRKWKAVDAYGNSGTCMQVITRNAGNLANIVFPKDTVLACNFGPYPTTAITGQPTLNGNPAVATCGIGTSSADIKLPVCNGSYNINRLWTVSNFCTSQTIQKNQLITVADGQGAQFLALADTLISSNPNQCCGSFKLPNIRLWDNCSRIKKVEAKVPNAPAVVAKLITLGSPPPLANDTIARFDTTFCIPAGITTITFTATDDCGNLSSCTFKVRVRDLTTPVAFCPGSPTLALSSDDPNDCYLGDVATVQAALLSTGSYDDCSPIRVTGQRIAPYSAGIQNLNKTNGQEPCNDTTPDAVSEFALATQESTALKFYCSEIGTPVPIRIKVYQLNPDGTVATFPNGQPIVNACTTNVTVQDVTPPTCTPPADITVNCADFDPKAAPILSPATPDNCCSPTFTAEWASPQNFCGGLNTRVFTVKDCYNNTSICSQKVTVVVQPPSYQIKFPDDAQLVGCQSVAPVFPQILMSTGCQKFKSVFKDSTIAGGGGAGFCQKILRQWTVYDSCAFAAVPTANFVQISNPAGSPAGPTIDFGSPDYNTVLNAYKFTQEISVNDNQPPQVTGGCTSATADLICDESANDPAYFNFPFIGDLGEAPATVSISAKDGCAGDNLTITYSLAIDYDANGVADQIASTASPLAGWGMAAVSAGGQKTATLQTPGGNLPQGMHILDWAITDLCGNTVTCRDTFFVKDCKPPVAVCKANFSKAMTQGGNLTILANELNNGSSDNQTPANQLQYAMRIKGTGTGYPQTTSLTFNCFNIAAQNLEMWVRDQSGNSSKCDLTVTITDPNKVCSSALVTGFIKNAAGSGLDNTTVNFGNAATADAFGSVATDAAGFFQSPALPGGQDVQVAPLKTDNPLNGVSTFDLVAMSKHVLNVAPFSEPWKFIAADINHNNQVTTFDIVELRKLILGVYTSFPANTSWRFVPKDWVFTDPANPFSPLFPEKSTLDSALIAAGAIDFLAIKTGDLTGDALTNFSGSGGDRTGLPPFVFRIEEKEFAPGEAFQTAIGYAGDRLPGGFQLTLEFDPKAIEIAALEPGAGMAAENFNLQKTRDGQVAVSWDGAEARPSFSLKINALRGGKLSEELTFGDKTTRREAFFENGVLAEPRLEFDSRLTIESDAGDRLFLFQNQPNPFSETTEITFFNPAPAPVVLRVEDATGRLIFEKREFRERGRQSFFLKKPDLGGADGLLFYSVQTPGEKAVRRMVFLD